MTHPPGLIVIPCSDQMRYPEFFIDFMNLQRPEGTDTAVTRSAAVVANINNPIRDMGSQYEWAWIMGDDHRIPADLLIRLLDLDADVAVPLCFTRTPPYRLVIMREEAEFTDEHTGRPYPGFLPYLTTEVPSEPFTVMGAGSAGLLIRRHVLETIGYPYFESTDGVHLNEDLNFCMKVREAGFEIVCDPAAWLGHIGQVHVWPTWHDGRIAIRLDHGGPAGQNEIVIGDAAVASYA